MRRLHVLLPQRGRASMDADALGRLARADRLVSSDPGHLHLLGDLFDWPGTSLPAGALMREHVAHDAGQEVWLCSDPAWVEADINGARMMACGNLELDQNESEQFAATLRPVLGDMGLMLELTTATRWHVRLPVGAALPPFAAPDQVLGDDLLRHLDGAGEMRRWRALFTTLQTELHQHPASVLRRERGQQPLNALWFWGGGSLPAWVRTGVESVFSDDPLVQAMASRAGAAMAPLARFDEASQTLAGEVLLDLGQHALGSEAWRQLFGMLDQRRVGELRLMFASGERYRLKRSHRWRFWRRRP
ncbi:MAG: phosphoglycerate mutase [Rhodanobacteraceae bacterium]